MKLNVISEKMLEALRCFLNGDKVTWEDGLGAEDWAELFRLCQHHQILPMIYDTVYACPAFAACPPELVQMIKRVPAALQKTDGTGAYACGSKRYYLPQSLPRTGLPVLGR